MRSDKLPKLRPPILPERSIPTPFGRVHLPEMELSLPKFPAFNEKSRTAMGHALGIDLSMAIGGIPFIGDVAADVVEDLHVAELRRTLTPKEYDEFEKHDKVSPATIAVARALTK